MARRWQNHEPNRPRAADEHASGRPAPHSYVTVIFDSDDEYVRFTDYVYDAFGAGALQFTDSPIPTSIRVRRDVLAQTQDSFAMHEFGERDRALAESLPRPRRWPFDADLIRPTPIPGVPDLPPAKQP
ncbi:MAG TPA: hypothetical protein VII06_21860 [Chloroflexota bacterium]|jgi:hypothetical protein